MTFDRHNDKATDVAQPHPKCEKLQKVGFACAGSTAYNGIGVLLAVVLNKSGMHMELLNRLMPRKIPSFSYSSNEVSG